MKTLTQEEIDQFPLDFVFDYLKEHHKDVYDNLHKLGIYEKSYTIFAKNLHFATSSCLNDLEIKVYDVKKKTMVEYLFGKMQKHNEEVFNKLYDDGFFQLCDDQLTLHLKNRMKEVLAITE